MSWYNIYTLRIMIVLGQLNRLNSVYLLNIMQDNNCTVWKSEYIQCP